MPRHTLVSFTAFLICMVAAFSGANLSAQDFPFNPSSCDQEWARSNWTEVVRDIPTLKYIESRASNGELIAQLRLGLVRRTWTGDWKVDTDRAYNIPWLEMASAQGSMSASWELASIHAGTISRSELLQSAVNAAIKDGNPWAATFLMRASSNQYGSAFMADDCDDPAHNAHCVLGGAIKPGHIKKWTLIAARGGNPAAQQSLCIGYSAGSEHMGVIKDARAAGRWCMLAVTHACSIQSIEYMKHLLDDGFTTSFESDAGWLKDTSKQIWRHPLFFY